jgi:hypothetical protein
MNDSSAGASGKKVLAVYVIAERGRGPNHWIRVGSAFTNRDGSMNLLLDALPFGTNRLQIREPRLEDVRGHGGNGAAQAAPEAEVRP